MIISILFIAAGEVIESPKRRLLNRRHVSRGDDLQEAGRSKRSRNKRKSTRESESSPGRNRDCPAEVRMFTVNQVIAKPLKEPCAHPRRTGDYPT